MDVPVSREQERQILDGERYELLQQLGAVLERPMAVLGFLWLVLVVVDLTAGLSPFLNALNYGIWGLFVLQFAVEFAIAPQKLAYLRRNWLTPLALVLPALRLVRVVRAVRAFRVLRAARGSSESSAPRTAGCAHSAA